MIEVSYRLRRVEAILDVIHIFSYNLKLLNSCIVARMISVIMFYYLDVALVLLIGSERRIIDCIFISAPTEVNRILKLQSVVSSAP
jgi:hypothetical protein